MEVGVDVEAIEETVDVQRIAARFFSESERLALASCAPARQRAAAFACWTRKEAYLKATGEGLLVSPQTIEVWTGDDRPAIVSGYSVRAVAVAQGFAAAVAGSHSGPWEPSGPHEPSCGVLLDDGS